MKFIRKRFWSLLLTGLCCSNAAIAQELANYSAAFVNIGFGARPLGMGQAYSALAADANSLVWNPAGMMEVQGFEATLSYVRQFNLIPYSFASLVYSPGNAVAFGGGAIVSGDDLLKEITFLSGLATRFQFDRLRMNTGLTLKLHSASFGKTGSEQANVQGDALGFSIDWGVQLFLSEKIILASQLQNLFNYLRWNTSTLGKYQEGLPKAWTIGIGLKDYHRLNFDLDFRKSLYHEIEDQIYLGAEQLFFARAYLRAGTASSLNQSQPLFYSFGGGIQQNFQNRFDFQLDAAYIIHPLENMFRLSLTFRLE